MRRFVFVVLLVCAVVALAACAPQATPVPPTPTPVPIKLTDGKVVLGDITDMTGPYAAGTGPNGIIALKMAVEDFKAKYGETGLGGPIEVIEADHQNKVDLGTTRAQEMYDQKGADAIFDVPGSGVAIAVADVANQKKKLYINTGSGSGELHGVNCNKYTFQYIYDSYLQLNGTVAWAVKNLGKKWYIIYPNYAFGIDMFKTGAQSVERNGGTVIGSEASPFPNTTGDFTPQLQKVQAAKPDVLATMNAGGDMNNLVRQYNVLGLRGQGIRLVVGLLGDTDVAALGPDAYEGVVYTTSWLWNQDEPSLAFADRFQKRTNVRPSPLQAATYSAAFQYMEAIRRARTDDADAVVKALEGYKFSDFLIRNGYVRPEDHWVMHDAILSQVKARSEMKDVWDYAKALSPLPAEQVSRPLAETGCNMPK